MPTSLKGDAYKHIPRTSTVASSTTGIPSVRSSERRDVRLVNAFLNYVVTLLPTHFPPCQEFIFNELPNLARRELSMQ